MRLAALAFVAALAGCATGTTVPADALSGIEPGKTTKTDIEARFGTPTFVAQDLEGRSLATYVYVDPRIRPKSFAPVALGTQAGLDADWTSTTFFFEPDGRLMEYRRFERRFGTGTEVFSKQMM